MHRASTIDDQTTGHKWASNMQDQNSRDSTCTHRLRRSWSDSDGVARHHTPSRGMIPPPTPAPVSAFHIKKKIQKVESTVALKTTRLCQCLNMQPVHPSILPSRLGSLGSIRAPVHPSILLSRLGSLGSIRALLPQRSVLATPHSTYHLGHSPLSVPSWPLLTQHTVLATSGVF